MRQPPYIDFIRRLCLLLALASTGVPAQTPDATGQTVEQKIYDVEIIIFKNKSVPKGHEINLPTPAAEHTPDSIDLFDPAQVEAAAERGFSILDPGEFRLIDEVSKIIRSSRYDLLAHIGWRQPGLDKENAIPVWIHGGKKFSPAYSSIDQNDRGLAAGNDAPLPAPDTGATTPEPTSTQQASVNQQGLYELEGVITIILARYLHSQVDLVLRKPASLENLLQRAAQSDIETNIDPERILLNYGLKERRRMRSKRLHYLDSPQFGMLVLITPYQKPAPETLDSDALNTLDAVNSKAVTDSRQTR